MKSERFILDKALVTEVEKPPFHHENAEIMWAHRTLMEYPGTHFYMPAFYSDPNGGPTENCTPCLMGWLAYKVTGTCSGSPYTIPVVGSVFDVIDDTMQSTVLLMWRGLRSEYSQHPREAVPKAVLIDAFERVCRGEKITVEG